MFRDLYWRWFKYKKFVDNPRGIAAFGMACSNALNDELGATTDSIKKKISKLKGKKVELRKEEKSLKASTILDNDDYHNVRFNIRLYMTVAVILLVTELGTNYFNALIIFGVESTGLGWTLAKWFTAIALTGIGVLAIDRFFEDLLPTQKYKSKEPIPEKNISMAVFWGLVLIGCELVIYLFGLSRAGDVSGKGAIEKSGVATDLAIGIIVLSMILPLIVGGVLRYIHVYRGAYKNRKNWDKNQTRLAKVETLLDEADDDKYLQFQKLASEWWTTFNNFKTFKESWNYKKGKDEENLVDHENYKFLRDVDAFKAPAYTHFTQQLGDKNRELPESEFNKSLEDDSDFDEEGVQNA